MDVLVNVEVVPVSIELGVSAITSLMGKLKENKVAGQCSASDLVTQSKMIETWIDVLDAQLQRIREEAASAAAAAAGDGDDPAAAARTPAGRLRLLRKKVSTEMNKAKELRNELNAIIAFKSNDSSSQAAFLTGMHSKFAAKAMARANNVSAAVSAAGSTAAMIADLKKVAAALPAALRKDALLKLSRFNARQLEQLGTAVAAGGNTAVAEMLDVATSAVYSGSTDASAVLAESPPTAEMAAFLDTVLPDALDAVEQTDASWLSLQTHRQQICEWVEMFGANADAVAAADVTSVYTALMCVGVHALPVEVKRSAATQMSPYMMKVSRVWPSAIDTCSLLYSLKMDGVVRAPEGGELKDMLPLIDPQLPNASRLVCRSLLMNHLTSVTLCRDLHMFLGNEQRMALHAHALVATITAKTGTAELGAAMGGSGIGSSIGGDSDGAAKMSPATVKQALKIIYSARKHLVGTFAMAKYVELLKRLQNWESLTEADGVDHTVQLLLAMLVVDKAELGMSAVLDSHAFFNLCNETLSRAARFELKASTDGSADVMRAAAHDKVVQLLSIDESSCPHPTAVEEPEPDRAAIAEECEDIRPGYTLTLQSETRKFCGRALEATVRCVAFANALQEYSAVVGMDAAMAEVEAGGGGDGGVVEWLVAHGATVGASGSSSNDNASSDILVAALGLAKETAATQDTVLVTMEAQAYKHHCSALRQGEGVLLDVSDTATLQKIAADARMQIYEQLLAVKMKEWSAIAGSITLQKARGYDDDQFCSWMEERHAHGYGKGEFWALAFAAKRSGGVRLAAFLATCNAEFCGGKGWSVL
jgi:hypothetical protein